MISRMPAVFLALILLISTASAQKAELSINFNESFFDALLDSVFLSIDPLEFPIAKNDAGDHGVKTSVLMPVSWQGPAANNIETGVCTESVKLLREMNDVRTAVRFREGKVYVPIAFTGSYSPPFVGCVEFAGWAEANIDIEFDQASQRVVGRTRILNVNLNGTGGVGGTVIARMIQGSIDKKMNPFEIVSLEKMSFILPIRGNGKVRAKATAVRPEIANALLSFYITYVFEKG